MMNQERMIYSNGALFAKYLGFNFILSSIVLHDGASQQESIATFS